FLPHCCGVRRFPDQLMLGRHYRRPFRAVAPMPRAKAGIAGAGGCFDNADNQFLGPNNGRAWAIMSR
ncbi:MAG: hypothetical protein OSB00_11510, partial [Sphingomonas bacterium]|nr:hypothetical protein [Sphingomonas bacterium]